MVDEIRDSKIRRTRGPWTQAPISWMQSYPGCGCCEYPGGTHVCENVKIGCVLCTRPTTWWYICAFIFTYQRYCCRNYRYNWAWQLAIFDIWISNIKHQHQLWHLYMYTKMILSIVPPIRIGLHLFLFPHFFFHGQPGVLDRGKPCPQRHQLPPLGALLF